MNGFQALEKVNTDGAQVKADFMADGVHIGWNAEGFYMRWRSEDWNGNFVGFHDEPLEEIKIAALLREWVEV